MRSTRNFHLAIALMTWALFLVISGCGALDSAGSALSKLNDKPAEKAANAQPIRSGTTSSATQASDGRPAGRRVGRHKIKDMRVDVLWPEFDRSGVRIAYEGELGDGVSLPVRMSFVVPFGAQILSACSLNADGTQMAELEKPLVRTVGGWSTVTYRVQEKRFRLEFYYSPIESRGAEKKFTYSFRTIGQIETLLIDVQQPLKANNFALNPPAQAITDTVRGLAGFQYHIYTYTGVKPAQTLMIDVTYNKSDPKPSMPKGSQVFGPTPTAAP